MSEKVTLTSARKVMLEVLPASTSLHGDAPEPRFVYLPASHTKALDPNVRGLRWLR